MKWQILSAVCVAGLAIASANEAHAQSSTVCSKRYNLAWEMPLQSSDVGRSVTDVFKRSEFRTAINVRGDRNRIAIGRAPTGDVALQMNIPKGENRSTNFFLAPLGEPGVDAACLSLRVFFENGFEWAKGGGGTKLGFGLWGGNAASQLSGGTAPSQQRGFSVRNVNNSWGVRLYSYHLNRSGAYGEQGKPLARWGSSDWRPGEWHEIELEVVLNDPGQSNGYTQIWLNGRHHERMTNLRFRNNNSWGIRGIHFSDIWGGTTSNPNNFSPKAQRMWYGDYKLYSARGGNIERPSQNQSEPNVAVPANPPSTSPNTEKQPSNSNSFGPVAPAGAVARNNLTLEWTADPNAAKYFIRVLTDRKKWADRKTVFSGSAFPQRHCNGSRCVVSIGSLPNDQYEWMVRPEYASGNGDYSGLQFTAR